jgi:Domain of Unknown Function (DUF928)
MKMSHPKTVLLGMLATLCLGTPTFGPSSVALFDESYAYDDTFSSDADMLIYKPRKNSTPSARIADSASHGILSTNTEMPMYKPPKGKEITPHARIGGQTRGSDAAVPWLIALVPDHIGFTMKHDTALCWYLQRQTSYPFTLTVTDSQRLLPILEQALPSPSRAGVHCARLQDYGVTLKEDEPYRWFVTLAVNPDRPSQDIVAGGMIERIPYNEACMLDMPCPWPSCEREVVYRYAEAGLWYDAVTCLEDLIQHDGHGDHKTLQRMQDVLLRQVGIQLPN